MTAASIVTATDTEKDRTVTAEDVVRATAADVTAIAAALTGR
jgi:hypothetical protein